MIAAADVKPTTLATLGLKNGMMAGRLEAIGMPVSPVTPFSVSWIRLADGGSMTTPKAPTGPVVEMKLAPENVMLLTCSDAKDEAMVSGPIWNVPPWNVPDVPVI